MTDGPLANLGKLSEPLTKLVEAVSAGVGSLYEPIGIVRKAKADARAAVILAKSQGEVATIQQRVAARLEHREGMRQENLEKITAIAASELPRSVSSEPVDLDWTIQFLDHAQDVNDEQMQSLWGRILAGEVANPGTYAKRTLAFLRSLEKWEAEGFTEFCSLALEDKKGWRFVFHADAYHELYRSKFEDRGYEQHFAAIGLLAPTTGMPNPSELNGRDVEYFGIKYGLVGPSKPDRSKGIASLEIGPSMRQFSAIGQQLAIISGAAPIDGYIDKLSASMDKEYGVRFERCASY